MEEEDDDTLYNYCLFPVTVEQVRSLYTLASGVHFTVIILSHASRLRVTRQAPSHIRRLAGGPASSLFLSPRLPACFTNPYLTQVLARNLDVPRGRN